MEIFYQLRQENFKAELIFFLSMLDYAFKVCMSWNRRRRMAFLLLLTVSVLLKIEPL